MWLYDRVLSPKDADGMANSVDPDQTAPLGAVWSGSALFAQAYLSENLGSLRYILKFEQCGFTILVMCPNDTEGIPWSDCFRLTCRIITDAEWAIHPNNLSKTS